MDTDTTWQTESTSPEATEALAERMGSKLRGGEVIELVSDLGGGKTTFTRGLVRGAGSTDKVASPSFTLNREYSAPNFTISHYDFYRLNEAGIVADELAEIVADQKYVTVVEWGEIVHEVLPIDKLTISINQTAEGNRILAFNIPRSRGYLLEDVRS